ncbi:MAG TPA: helix-turn-helix domain-containing protein [Solirubrobacteraceae bacterium]|jgi:AraC-like DNA-binding protein
MTLLIDTGVVDAQDRVDFWASASCQAYHPLQIRADGTGSFAARMWGNRLASIALFRVAASPNVMRRTRKDIAAGDDETLHFSLVLHGILHGAQQDRSSVLGPGDMTTYDTSQPTVFQAPEDFDLLVLKLPKAILGRDVTNKLSRLTAVRIAGGSGLPRLAARFFCGTAAGLADGSIDQADANLAEHVIDLVRRLYLDLEAAPGNHPRCRGDLYLQAKAYIQAHLGDPDLDPERVARACFVSTRYLHRVFADEDRTVAEWIRSERLEHCRRNLLDPGLSHQPISAIATRWGLPNASHFSRLFHRAYGCSPRDFRHGAGDPAP